MRASRVFWIAVLTAILGFAGGYVFYAKTVARYDAISSACVAMQEAVKHDLLTIEQVKELGSLSGRMLRQSYSAVAEKLHVAPEDVHNASNSSVCSQYLVGVNTP